MAPLTEVIRVKDATIEQLLVIARDVLNLDVEALGPEPSTESLRSMVQAVHAGVTIEIPAQHARPARPRGRPKAAESAKEKAGDSGHPRTVQFNGRTAMTTEDGRVCVLLQESEDDVVPYHEVSVNGRVMLVPKGRPVLIPLAYYEVLCNAIRRMPIVNRKGEIERWRDIAAVQFSEMDPASAQVMA